MKFVEVTDVYLGKSYLNLGHIEYVYAYPSDAAESTIKSVVKTVGGRTIYLAETYQIIVGALNMEI